MIMKYWLWSICNRGVYHSSLVGHVTREPSMCWRMNTLLRNMTENCLLGIMKYIYVVVSNIFRTDAVKILKLTIRPIGRRHPRSSSLPHVDTGPTVSSIFGTLRGSPFLSDCQALSAIWPVPPQWYQTCVLSASISFLEIVRSHRVPNQGSMLGGG